MSNVATLTLKGVSDLSPIARDLKNIAAEGRNAGPALANLNKSLDQSTKAATTFGQKIKNFGSTFQNSIGSLATLGGTVLNLSRQYQDLSDSQIRVDRMQLRVSKTTEAVGLAQGKLNALTAKGITSGAEYEQALLNVKQGLEAQDLAERNLKEAQEDHQRAQENFWIGLVPTVTSAGASVISVLSEIGGTKGLGGLKTALTGFGGKASGLLGGLIAGLGGIGGAAKGSIPGLNGMAGATTGLGTAMKGLALSSLPVAVAIGGIAVIAKESGIVIHEITSIMKGDMLEAVTSLESLINLFSTLSQIGGPMGAGFAALSNLKFAGGKSLTDEVARIKKELQGVPQVIHEVNPALQSLDNQTQGVNKSIDSLVGGVMGLVQHANAVPGPANAAAGAIGGIGTAASGASAPVDGLGTSLGSMANQATITGQGMGAVSTGMIDVAHNAANTSSQTDPFSISLGHVAEFAHEGATELDLLTFSAAHGAAAFQKQTQAVNNLASTLAKATKNVIAYTNASQRMGGAVNNSPYRVSNTGGAGKGPAGSHYVTFRDGKPIASGSGMAPPIRKAATGMHEMITRPTWILAGESGQERVDIGKGGGGGFNGIINVYVDGVLQRARYDINKFQGVMK